jgi:hypothetical protein
MSGKVFSKLSKLKFVNLSDNECLNQKFEGNALTSMAKTVTNACEPDMEMILIAEYKQNKDIFTQQLEKFKTSISQNFAKLEEELKSCKSQIESINGPSATKVRELRDMVELKVKENQKLSRELEVKQTVFNEQAKKIKN